MPQFLQRARYVSALANSALLLAFLCLPAHLLFAVNCAVVHHPATTDADRAFLSGDFDRAAGLYSEALAKAPAQPDLVAGRVHALLRQQKVIEAADTLRSLTGANLISAPFLTLRAEVELRAGEPWTAAESAVASAKLDPCNPRTILLLARVAALNSRFATAHRLLATARQLDPEDPDIWAAWMDALPPGERIPQLEAYLATPRGDDAETRANRKIELDQLKKWAENPHPPCTMVPGTTSTTIPFSALRTIHGDVWAPSIDVKVNDHRIRLSIDTSYNARLPIDGVSGLLILKEAADHMGLKPIFENMVPGVDGQGPRAGYVAYADSIAVGGFEFHNCAVQVMKGLFWSDADGAVNFNLFSNMLVSINYQNDKLVLSPLPPLPAGSPSNGPADGYVAPEMKDYTHVYRTDTDLFVPVVVNRKGPLLFLIDTAVGRTVLSPEASHEIAEGHKDPKYEVQDSAGHGDRFSAADVQLALAGLTKNIAHIDTFDTARFTSDAGMDISGLVADDVLRYVTIHLDYRDGLVKLDFATKDAKTP